MKVLLNALILIIVAHIVMKNIEEGMTNYEIQENLNHMEEVIEEEEEIEEFGDDLLEYMQSVDYEVKPFQNSIINTPPNKVIQPSNYYEEEIDKIDNAEPSDPNFQPGITNLNKYFTSLKPKDTIPIDKTSNEPFIVSDNDNGCSTTNLRWKYKDEQVQNGGDFLEGVTAFNDMDDGYAVYDTTGANLHSLNDIGIPENSDIATVDM